MLWKSSVLHDPPFAWYLARLSRQQLGVSVVAIAAAAGVTWFALTRKRVSPAEVEQRRRTLLAEAGRIIDGSIIGVDNVTEDNSADGTLILPPGRDLNAPPHVLLYRYRIAGVTYECAQDVSGLGELVRHLRIDLPVQVRYDPHNPEDSILVAEGGSGLQRDAV